MTGVDWPGKSTVQRAPAAWISLFDERCRQNLYPYGSGVWAKKEWVVPFIDDENIVCLGEGEAVLRAGGARVACRPEHTRGGQEKKSADRQVGSTRHEGPLAWRPECPYPGARLGFGAHARRDYE